MENVMFMSPVVNARTIDLMQEVTRELASQEELEMLPRGLNSESFRQQVLERAAELLDVNSASYVIRKPHDEVRKALQEAISQEVAAHFRGWR